MTSAANHSDFTAPAKRAGVRKTGLYVSIVILVGVGASIALLQMLRDREHTYAVSRFHQDAHERGQSIENMFSQSAEPATAYRAFYGASNEVERDEFEVFSSLILRTHPEIECVQWLPRISIRQRDDFEERLALFHPNEAHITECDGRGRLVNSASREEYYPVAFAEPLEAHRMPFGFDYSSDPTQLTVMRQARDSGQIAASQRLTLYGRHEGRPERPSEIILYMPIYRNGVPVDTVQQRQEQLQGFVTSIIRLDALVASALKPLNSAGIDFYLYDVTSEDSPQMLHTYSSNEGHEPFVRLADPRQEAPGGVFSEYMFRLTGRQYSIIGVPADRALANRTSSSPTVVFLSGIIVTSIFGIYLYRLSSESTRVEQLVALRTAELGHERTRLRQEIAERTNAEQRLKAVLDACHRVAVIATDTEGTVTLFNSGSERLLGYKAEQVVGKQTPMLWHLESEVIKRGEELSYSSGHKVEGFDVFVQSAREGRYDEREWTFVHRDGAHRTVLLNVTAITDGQAITGFLGAAIDITDRKKAEERFQQVVEACPSALVMVNSDGVILLVNGETERMFGYDRGELLGQKVEVLVPSGFRAQHPQQRRQYFDAPVPRAMGSNKDLFALRKDGSEFPVEIGLNPIETDNGPAALSAIVDITERKKSQESLNHYAAELKRSNDELDQFAYVASHDLKAPLRGLDNVSAWIAEDLGDDVPEKTRGHLQKMRQRVKRMEMLLDDLLSYSRAGRVKGDIKQVDVGELVRDVTQLLALPEGITVDTRDPLPTLTAHKVPLELVFRNLIGNAVKHHDRPDGRVDVSAIVNGTFVEFTVADNGPGIDSKYHERIFDMFKTLRPRDQVEGSGMGLAVVKKTIESQGGSITVDSDGTRGTRFRFTWPKTVAA